MSEKHIIGGGILFDSFRPDEGNMALIYDATDDRYILMKIIHMEKIECDKVSESKGESDAE